MIQSKDLDWLFKCRQCKHHYQVQAGEDEVRCRLKYCRYEPYIVDMSHQTKLKKP